MGKEVGPRADPFTKPSFKRPILKEQFAAVITYITAFDETRNRLYISPQIEAMLGFSADEWLGDPSLFLKQLHPEDRDRVLAEVFQSKDSEKPLPALGLDPLDGVV